MTQDQFQQEVLTFFSIDSTQVNWGNLEASKFPNSSNLPFEFIRFNGASWEGCPVFCGGTFGPYASATTLADWWQFAIKEKETINACI